MSTRHLVKRRTLRGILRELTIREANDSQAPLSARTDPPQQTPRPILAPRAIVPSQAAVS